MVGAGAWAATRKCELSAGPSTLAFHDAIITQLPPAHATSAIRISAETMSPARLASHLPRAARPPFLALPLPLQCCAIGRTVSRPLRCRRRLSCITPTELAPQLDPPPCPPWPLPAASQGHPVRGALSSCRTAGREERRWRARGRGRQPPRRQSRRTSRSSDAYAKSDAKEPSLRWRTRRSTRGTRSSRMSWPR